MNFMQNSSPYARQPLVALFVLICAIVSMALPAAAGRPGSGTATATLTRVGTTGCTYRVTYDWGGFAGKNLTATFGVYYRSAGLDVSLQLSNVAGQDGTRPTSGPLEATFDLSSENIPSTQLVARGTLQKVNVHKNTYTAVTGSNVASGTQSKSGECP